MNDRRDDSPDDRAAGNGQWDRYWAHGRLTSCADAFDGNYEGAIADRWAAFFATLPDDARILDVCTGNGAIAALAAGHAIDHDKRHAIDAIDLAIIHPEVALADRPELTGRIAFHSRVGADAMPFDDGSFDAVVGQYALEYTPMEATVREIGRVTAQGGRIMFVMHHAASIVISTAAEELRNGERLFADASLFDVARAFIDYVGRVPPGAQRRALAADPRAEDLRRALNEAAAAVSRAAAASPHPELLTNALGLVGEAYKAIDQAGRRAAIDRLDAGQGELEANLARLDDLMNAAVSADDARRIGDWFRDAGFGSIELEELHHNGARLMGWVLTAARI